jgi:hypothetical protein
MDFAHGAVSFGTGLITGGMNAIAGGVTLLSDASHIHYTVVKLCAGNRTHSLKGGYMETDQR